MKLKLLVASVVAATSFSAMAADQVLFLNDNPLAPNFFTSVQTVGDSVLSGGLDVITFDGLGAGAHTLTVTISGQNLTFDAAQSNLNGTHGAVYGSKLRFFDVEHTGVGPYVLNLYGAGAAGAKYSGEVTVTPVPEPATYGMLLGGLGMLGWLARRKEKQDV
ncbi:MAG: FxDxF family PEP-CTERM protein [Pseudomonadota bacterium]